MTDLEESVVVKQGGVGIPRLEQTVQQLEDFVGAFAEGLDELEEID